MGQAESIQKLNQRVNQYIIGQQLLVDRLLIALLCDGHLLVEGAPGLAKTRAIKVLSEAIEGDFHRIQFTPDLLPADLTGTEVFRQQTGTFAFQKGPLFHNLILADEINRAPAKVQSALLEAMAERQITVGMKTYPLPSLFLVMATQNPIEQEGTYPLPEAQLDRFLMHVRIDYPDPRSEKSILALARAEAAQEADHKLAHIVSRGNEPAANTTINRGAPEKVARAHKEIITQAGLFEARKEVLDVHLAKNLEQYLLEIVLSTRKPKVYGDDLANWIQYGASPRATIALDRCARAHAWLAGRDYVDPQDIQNMAYDVLRHRILVSYEAEAEGITPDRFIETLISRIAVP
ncbi:MAG: MoxR family ATPase [Gammaproteobacteria bacterium]|nr:MoxR family ATPase [Gammaproteobacteria bacterium]